MLELTVENIGALKNVRWAIPEGVSVLVGPNGSGKSTLLRMLAVLRAALAQTLPVAADHYFGGARGFRHVGAAETEQSRIELQVGDAQWWLRPTVQDASVSAQPEEEVRLSGKTVLRREAGAAQATFGGAPLVCGGKLALAATVDYARTLGVEALSDSQRQVVAMLASTYFYQLYASYDFNLSNLLRGGSQHGSDQILHASGQNVFTVLRNWSLKRDSRPQYQFVIGALGTAFPDFEDFDFEQAGTTVTVTVHHRGAKTFSILQESTGFVCALLHLTAVASASAGTVVGIDEIENSLHPEAIRSLLASIRRFAAERRLYVLLATHSPVVLDEFRDDPERVFVMEPGRAVLPVPVSELFDRDWLSQFSLGGLYAGKDFGAPVRPNAAE